MLAVPRSLVHLEKLQGRCPFEIWVNPFIVFNNDIQYVNEIDIDYNLVSVFPVRFMAVCSSSWSQLRCNISCRGSKKSFGRTSGDRIPP